VSGTWRTSGPTSSPTSWPAGPRLGRSGSTATCSNTPRPALIPHGFTTSACGWSGPGIRGYPRLRPGTAGPARSSPAEAGGPPEVPRRLEPLRPRGPLLTLGAAA
jgi:hypothetical protein